MTKKHVCWRESHPSCQKRRLLRREQVMRVGYTDTRHLTGHAQMQTVLRDGDDRSAGKEHPALSCQLNPEGLNGALLPSSTSPFLQ